MTDFSGMDAHRYARKDLGVTAIAVSASDTSLVSNKLIHHNYDCDPFTEHFHAATTTGQKDIDLYVAGLPCQPWSTDGKRKGENDPRAKLYEDTITRIAQLKPKVCLLGKSLNLAFSNKDKTLNKYICILEAAGYVAPPPKP